MQELCIKNYNDQFFYQSYTQIFLVPFFHILKKKLIIVQSILLGPKHVYSL